MSRRRTKAPQRGRGRRRCRYQAGVVGTGFIGVVHVEALRRLGIEVAGVVGSSPDRAREKPGLPEPYESYEALLADDTRRRRPHHDAEPSPLPAGEGRARGGQARGVREAARARPRRRRPSSSRSPTRAGSSTARTSTSASTASATPRATACAPASSAASSTCTAATSRTGCSKDTDWNWRLDPAQGGALRAVADIGSHWLDLVGFVTGKRVASVFADLATVHAVRRVPTGPVETFSDGAGDVERVDRELASEDFAHVLRALRGRRPRRRSCVSQVSAGRKNRVWFEADGTERRARVGRGGAGAAVARPPRPAERGALARAGADQRLPERARRGLPRHVQAALPRRLPRGRGRADARRRGRVPDLPRRSRGGARSARRSPRAPATAAGSRFLR